MKIIDTAGNETTLDAITAASIAWHAARKREQGGSTIGASGACRQGWHKGCKGVRTASERAGRGALIPCECVCRGS